MIVGGIYMAIDPDVYRDGLTKLFPPEWHPQIRATLDDAGAALRLWLGAQVIAMLMIGVLIGGGALLLGIPSPFALGLSLVWPSLYLLSDRWSVRCRFCWWRWGRAGK